MGVLPCKREQPSRGEPVEATTVRALVGREVPRRVVAPNRSIGERKVHIGGRERVDFAICEDDRDVSVVNGVGHEPASLGDPFAGVRHGDVTEFDV